MTAEALRYFAAAERFLEPHSPRLVALGGLSGSGKTTLAAAIAPFVGRPPGAVHLRSDIERKVLAGVDETDRLPADSYTQAASDAVYETLRRKAGLVLAAGQSVIVDAVHERAGEREAIEATAASAGVPFSGIWLDAPVDVLVGRVRARTGDASDATEQVVQLQAGRDIGSIRWIRLSAVGEAGDLTKDALYILRGDQDAPDPADASSIPADAFP